jgi:hypothetical protein
MNALVPQETRAIGAVVYSFDEKRQMAECLAQSGLFGVKNATQALALMLVAEAEGEHPASIASDYDIIQGKGSRKTHSVLARFQAMGGKLEWHELTHTRAEATFSHPKGGSLRLDWTYEQAQKAGLVGKDNWKGYARAMLRARLIAEGVRAVYPAAIGGWQVPEEAMGPQLDAEPPPPPTIKHMGAAEVVQPTATPAPAATQAPADTRPPFPDEDFQRGLPVWRKAAGKLAVAEVLARAEAANPDYAFTEQQKATILSLKKAEPAPTFAAVADALNKAQDADALAVAGDLIGAVADEQQRAELRAIYSQREQALQTVEG